MVEREAVVNAVADTIEAHYIDETKALTIAQSVRAQDIPRKTNSAVGFANWLSGRLFRISNDRHLTFKYDPARFASVVSPPSGEGDQAEMDYLNEVKSSSNYGFNAIGVLDGNIGYAKLTRFWGSSAALTKAQTTMQFLEDTDALIFDLRDNGGGSTEMVRYLQSFFVPQGSLLMRYQDAREAPLVEDRTRPIAPLKSRQGQPLFVLINEGSASASEDFAYSAQSLGYGKVVGTQSSGAAHTTDDFAIEPAFMLAVSVGRPVHPVTGENWEGAGVTPDIEVESATQIEQAYLEALKAVDTAAARWAALAVVAGLRPPEVSRRMLVRIAGNYGDYSLVYNDGRLFLENGDKSRRPLKPLTPTIFAVGPDDKVRIQLIMNGRKIYGFDWLTPDGTVTRFERIH